MLAPYRLAGGRVYSRRVASVTARGRSWRVQARDQTGRLRGATFAERSEANSFAESVDLLGWEAAYAALAGVSPVSVRPLSLSALREIVLSSGSEWHVVDEFGGRRAVYEPDVSIALEWVPDVEAMRRAVADEVTYSCYPGVTRDRHSARVLVHGQPIIQATLLTVKQTWRKRDDYFFVPHAYLYRRRWLADEFEYGLARAVNAASWGFGFADYMKRSGVQPRVS